MQVSLNKAGKILVQNVNTIRKESRLTVKELAEATGVSKDTIYRMNKARKERRTYRPMLSTVVKLAKASNISIDDLVSGKVDVQ